jgi:hypothetical protein
MRELRLETIRATTRVKPIEVIPIKAKLIKGFPTEVMPIRHTPAQDTLPGRRHVRMGTIPIIRMPARRTASTVRNGSLAECLSVSALGTTGAGVTADTTVGWGIGGMLVGVAPAGAMDAGTLVVTAAAMLEDTPGAVKFMAAEASMVEAQSTVEEASTAAEAGSTAVAVDTVADTGNRVER